MAGSGVVTAVSRSHGHGVGKTNHDHVTLLAGHGVEGDVHAGATVKHRSRVLRDAEQPNLRQVHLIHAERRGAAGRCRSKSSCRTGRIASSPRSETATLDG
jgi:hypothetical protein